MTVNVPVFTPYNKLRSPKAAPKSKAATLLQPRGGGRINPGLPAPSSSLLQVYFAGRNTRLGSVIETLSVEERKAVHAFGENYKKFLAQAVCSSWAAHTIIQEAERRGFKPFPKNAEQVKPGDKYYFNNDGESVALAVIGEHSPLDAGFNIVGAHVDSPQLELKPNTVVESNGIAQLKTKPRGGGTWMTWFNRPLGIAGRVFEPVLDDKGQPKLDPITHLPVLESRLVRVDSPSVVIPVEAIHFNRELNTGRNIDKESDLNPVAALERAEANGRVSENVIAILKQHGVDLSQAHRAELFLFPTTPPVDTGVDNSMILAQGHDDRAMCYAAMEALFEAAESKTPPTKTSVAFFFDNEETGSLDRGGAKSRWAETVAGKLVAAQSPQTDELRGREEALSKTFIFSADVAHGWFPSHAKYHDGDNAVHLGQGPAIKADTSGHYATTPKGMTLAEALFKRAGVPFQVMSTRQNVPCGTTIGPMIAANTNALTVDIGAPVLSMHSAQEVAAKVDVYLTKKIFSSFFRNE